jgi:N-acetylmuramic acid 6-phosphate etherase
LGTYACLPVQRFRRRPAPKHTIQKKPGCTASGFDHREPERGFSGVRHQIRLEIARIINHEDAKIAAAVKKAIPEIAQVIDQVARSLRDGGRLIYVGAGSSGRIAALDSSECPPTYSTAPGQVQYIMAGGPKALASAVEVNEDSEELGQRDIARRRPTRKDVVIGLSASAARPMWLLRLPMPAPAGAYSGSDLQPRHSAGRSGRYCIVAEVGPKSFPVRRA